MNIFPAIDLMDGQCVRLKQGDFARRVDYAPSPLEMARLFERMGYEWLHVVDLDGAREGSLQNASTIEALVKQTNLKLQVGGGIRDLVSIEKWLKIGVSRVMLGTVAVKNPELVAAAVAEFGAEKIVVAVDFKGKEILISGWQESAAVNLDEFIQRMISVGVRSFLCTNTDKDGMTGGVDARPYAELVRKYPDVEWVAAGGVRTLQDREALVQAGVSGAVMGSIFYEGSLLSKRIIPCLDVKNGRTVKGVNFQNLKDAGDPVALAKLYASQGADELTFLDITASSDQRNIVLDLVRAVAKEVNIPFTVGGGIRSLNDIRAVLEAGADKVSISSALVLNPDLANQAAREFGSQCLVASVDSKRVDGAFRVTIKGGREITALETVAWCQELADRGVGEILLNSMDADGTKSGFDLEMTGAVRQKVSVPLIASGGAGCVADFKNLFEKDLADAALAAGIFHFGEVNLGELKEELLSYSLPIRPC
jgi:cyclase